MVTIVFDSKSIRYDLVNFPITAKTQAMNDTFVALKYILQT